MEGEGWGEGERRPESRPAAERELPTRAIAGLSTLTSSKSPEFFQSAARLGVQAAEALDHAHRAGVVHRDIKPSNLMVDADGHLYVTDFGLARMQSETGLTLSGDVLGTLRYMSPEQAAGETRVVDHRTDIYSLGATLYELLTLEPAFPAADRAKLLRDIADRDPPPPRTLNESVSRDLETIVQRAMAKQPQARYATAQALADDLRRFSQSEPLVTRPARRGARWGRLLSRRWKAACVAAAALALLAGVLGAIFLFCFQKEGTAMFSMSKPQRQAVAAAVLALAAGDAAAAGKPGGGGIADPKNLQVSYQSVFRIQLQWQSGSPTTTGYKVAYSATSYPPPQTGVDVGNVTSYWIVNLNRATKYYFRVCAYDKKGKISNGATITGTTSTAPAPVRYQVKSLGTGFVRDMNNQGEVVGCGRDTGVRFAYVCTAHTAWVWTDLNLIAQIPEGFYAEHAFGINESGQIVGNAVDELSGINFGYLYDPATTVNFILLPSPTIGCNTYAEKINERGQIVGYWQNQAGEFRTLLWNPPYDAASLVDFAVPVVSAEGPETDINDDGVVVTTGGYRLTPRQDGTYAQEFFPGLSAHGLNQLGHFVGRTQIVNSTTYDAAFCLKDAGPEILYQWQPATGDSAIAWDINSAGQVTVNGMTDRGYRDGFLHTDQHLLLPLDDLVATGSQEDLDFWKARTGAHYMAINDPSTSGFGQITVHVLGSPRERVYLLTPVAP